MPMCDCETCKAFRGEMQELRDYIMGTPTTKGLVRKVDLLLERAESTRWWGRTALGGAITSIVGALVAAVLGAVALLKGGGS